MRVYCCPPGEAPYPHQGPLRTALPPPPRVRYWGRKVLRWYQEGRRRTVPVFRDMSCKMRRGIAFLSNVALKIWFWATKHWRFLAIVSAALLPISLIGITEWGAGLGILAAAYVYATIKYPRLPLLTVVYGWEGFRQFCRVVGELFCIFLPYAEVYEDREDR